MSVLSRFLKEEGERLRAGLPEREAKLTEWKDSVRNLMAQLAGWVREADPQGLIEIDDTQSQRLMETELGLYYATRLELRFVAHQIWVIPKARNVVAFIPSATGDGERRADGVVIVTDYPPNGDQIPAAVYNLYRVAESGGDRWFIRYATSGKVEPLDRDRFETVLVNMLQ
jgi:hypothetical protein